MWPTSNQQRQLIGCHAAGLMDAASNRDIRPDGISRMDAACMTTAYVTGPVAYLASIRVLEAIGADILIADGVKLVWA